MGQLAGALPGAVLLNRFLERAGQLRVHDGERRVQPVVGERTRLLLRGHGGWWRRGGRGCV